MPADPMARHSIENATDEIDLITHRNAEKLFHFPLSQQLIDAYNAPGA